MSINIKKYTKEQMAQMVEEAQAEVQELKRVNAALTEQLEQMNGEAINRANEITTLKAEAQDLRGKLADTETALGRANAETARLRSLLEKERRACYNAEQNAKWAAAHPWRNLWAWFRHKA